MEILSTNRRPFSDEDSPVPGSAGGSASASKYNSPVNKLQAKIPPPLKGEKKIIHMAKKEAKSQSVNYSYGDGGNRVATLGYRKQGLAIPIPFSKELSEVPGNLVFRISEQLTLSIRWDYAMLVRGKDHLIKQPGVGLKLEDALAFWRAEFSQKVGSERFDKEYSYAIRHNYGKEGKRTDYTPYACQKIIMSSPGVGDHHGCPYRHFSDENLRAALGKMGVNARTVDDVMDKVRNRHYQLACTLTFEALHACSCDTGINHPNQYFKESRKVFQAKNQISEPGGSPSTPMKSRKANKGPSSP